MHTNRTKIIATIGPASSSAAIIRQCIAAGVNIFRINFSHSSHSDAEKVAGRIRKISKELQLPVGIMGDLQGPKIRIGRLLGGSHYFKEGANAMFVPKQEAVIDDEIPLPERECFEAIAAGDHIVLGDGEISLEILEKNEKYAQAKIINEGMLRSYKGFHIPGKVLDLKGHLDKDKQDFLFCLEKDFDFVLVSFVQNAPDLLVFKQLAGKQAKDILLGAKIETRSSIANLDAIIGAADFVVAARGDLAIETSYYSVPVFQKEILKKANQAGIPAVVATQMLESMIRNEEPTRAEISDIANAVLDSADALLLSGETAVGKYPVQAIQMLQSTITYTEQWQRQHRRGPFRELCSDDRVADAISKGAMIAGNEIKAKGLICTTNTGKTARLLSRYRPDSPILAFTYNENVLHRLVLFWGVCPFHITYREKPEQLIDESMEKARRILSLVPGDYVIYTAGLEVDSRSPKTNFMYIRKIT